MQVKNKSTVAILLCTYNGEKYLREQLDSILLQTHQEWHLYVSDDGSSDTTLGILAEYKLQLQERLTIVQGPKKGFAWNFLSLVFLATNLEYYAFCDQDDIWMPDKLQVALEYLEKQDNNIPQLYCGRSLLVNSHDQEIGFSPLFKKKPSFNNALAQSIAGGNTMLFNKSARDLIVQTPLWEKVVAHDWWVYILVAGSGSVYYDPIPKIRYRQHGGNVIGTNTGVYANINRLKQVLGNRLKGWIDCNLSLLSVFRNRLKPENLKILNQFEKARKAFFLNRLMYVFQLRIYRQTLFQNVLFKLLFICGKV